eukprot:3504107-Rhodomonas_salina.1
MAEDSNVSDPNASLNATDLDADRAAVSGDAGSWAGVRVGEWGYLSENCRVELAFEPEEVSEVEGGWRL